MKLKNEQISDVFKWDQNVKSDLNRNEYMEEILSDFLISELCMLSKM